MTLASANTNNGLTQETFPDRDHYMVDVDAFEEDIMRDSLNEDTFDPDMDIWISLGNFEFTHRVETILPEDQVRHPGRSIYYTTTDADQVCGCGLHVASQLCRFEAAKVGYRIYIPRLMVADNTYQGDQHIHQYIVSTLGAFCNIVNIEFRWLWLAADMSCLVHLDNHEPFKNNNTGQTMMCNLSCPRCKSLNLHINKNVYWKLLPNNR